MHHINTFLWLVNQVCSSRFTYSSQQKFAEKVRVLPVRQFAVRSSLITHTRATPVSRDKSNRMFHIYESAISTRS